MPTTITGTDGVSQVQAGAVESGDLPAGSVIQVVEGTSNSTDSTTSTSFVSSSISASITPSSSSNKIYVVSNMHCNPGSDGTTDEQMITTLFRDSVNLGGGSDNSLGYTRVRDGRGKFTVSMIRLDSPSSTNSLTYTVYFRSRGGGTCRINNDNTTGVITLMEIAG